MMTQTARHIMVDIETLGIPGPDFDPIIWQVGWQEFRINERLACSTDADYLEQGDFTLLAREQEVLGRKADPDTIAWMKQKGTYEAYVALQEHGPIYTIAKTRAEMFASFVNFDGSLDNLYVWCKGGSFDFALLRSLMGDLPWHYRAECCMRPVLNLATMMTGIPLPKIDGGHRAFSDAQAQIKLLDAGLQRLATHVVNQHNLMLLSQTQAPDGMIAQPLPVSVSRRECPDDDPDCIRTLEAGQGR